MAEGPGLGGAAGSAPKSLKSLTKVKQGTSRNRASPMACPMVSQQVDLTLPLLLLQPEFSSPVAEGATTAKKDENCPEQPEPCERQEEHISDYWPRPSCREESSGAEFRNPREDGQGT